MIRFDVKILYLIIFIFLNPCISYSNETSDQIKITPETVGLQIKYNNTRGLAKEMTNTTNMISRFDSAFFDFDLIAR